MAIDNKIKDEKPQYDINRKAAKISAFSSGLRNKKISDEIGHKMFNILL